MGHKENDKARARLLAAPEGMRGIQTISFSADGALLAAGESSGPMVAVWRTKDGKVVWRHELATRARRHAWEQQVKIAIKSKLLAATIGKELTVFDLASGNVRAKHTLDRFVAFVAFTPDPKKVLVGMLPHVHRLDWRSGSVEHTVDAHCASTYGAPVSPDGRTVVLAGSRIHVCDARTLEVRSAGRMRGYACAAAFSSDGKTFATAGDDGVVAFWDVRSGKRTNKVISSPTKRRGIEAQALAYHPGGKTLAVATDDGYVRLWDVAARKVVREFAGHDTSLPETGARNLHGLAFAPDGNTLYVGAVTGGARGITAYSI